jgi:dTDP-4-dehydrorhamnose 3,5-epimerase
MNIIETQIPEVFVIEPRIFHDDRGYFMETYRHEWLESRGVRHDFVQDNLSRSHQGVLRGLHYQITNAQAKLVTVTAGEVLDVAVDLRRGSPSFGAVAMHLLTAENRKIMYIPEGFAHGFMVLSAYADFKYKCSRYYDPSGERGLHYADPDLAIQWPLQDPRISQKDRELPFLRDIAPADLPEYRPTV